MPNRDSEKLITDGYTTTLLGDELMVCENMKHIRVTSVPSYTEVDDHFVFERYCQDLYL